MRWSAIVVPLLITLPLAWSHIASWFGGRSRRVEAAPLPSPKSRELDEFRRKLANINIEDLQPPHASHASEPWDKYWRLQYETGVWGFHDMFVDDRELVSVMNARGFRTVLCVGAGLSVEPHALVAAGFAVTMLDISPDVVAAMRAIQFKPEAFGRVLDAAQLRPGGSFEAVAGDLSDVAFCPGPYDVVIERKTLQLFPDTERGGALAAVAQRMNPNGILITHVHDGCASATRPATHYVAPFLAGCGFTRGTLESSKATPGRTAVTFLSTG